MISTYKRLRAAVLTFSLALTGTSLADQSNASTSRKEDDKKHPSQITGLQGGLGGAEDSAGNLARRQAIAAGYARFCRLDPEQIDHFISKSEAAISVRAKDDYEKVIAQIAFKNALAAASGREPDEGCTAFAKRFEKLSRAVTSMNLKAGSQSQQRK